MRPLIIDYLNGSVLAWLAPLVPRPGLMYGIMLVVLAWVFHRRATRIGLDGQGALEIVLATAVSVSQWMCLVLMVTGIAFLFQQKPQSLKTA